MTMLNATLARALQAHLDGAGIIANDGEPVRIDPDAIDTFNGQPIECQPVFTDDPSFELTIGDETFVIRVTKAV